MLFWYASLATLTVPEPTAIIRRLGEILIGLGVKVIAGDWLSRREFLAGCGMCCAQFSDRGSLSGRRENVDNSALDQVRPARQPASSRSTGYCYDPVFLKHTQVGHPESGKRLEAILRELESSGLIKTLQHVSARPATIEELGRVHTLQYVRRIEEFCRAGGGNLDADTYANSSSFEAACAAAGGVTELACAVVERRIRNGFALIRPPGHHALPGRAMGFCLFNNVAIAARSLQKERGLERVAVVDFDVHHGNGTQAAFETDASVLYVSTHQYPHYPGTGRLEETGTGQAKGTKVNLPLMTEVGDEGFRAIFDQIVIPILERFRPDMILVSAGYDAHWDDPLAGLGLSLSGMAWVSQTLVEAAEGLCDGRIVFALEGGYNLRVLGVAAANTFRALLGRRDYSDALGKSPYREPDLAEYLARAKKVHGLA